MQSNLPEQYYHLSCPNCDKDWWMNKGIFDFCPFCGYEINKPGWNSCVYKNTNPTEKNPYKCILHPGVPTLCETCEYWSNVKDCTSCKYGQYNDRYETYFCYNMNEYCKEWDKWEARSNE